MAENVDLARETFGPFARDHGFEDDEGESLIDLCNEFTALTRQAHGWSEDG